jgi:hypothetical protein
MRRWLWRYTRSNPRAGRDVVYTYVSDQQEHVSSQGVPDPEPRVWGSILGFNVNSVRSHSQLQGISLRTASYACNIERSNEGVVAFRSNESAKWHERSNH